MLPRIHGEGGVVRDPEIRFAQSGRSWAKVTLACKDRVRGDKGEWVDGDPTFIDVTCFGKQAENLVESVRVGDMVTFAGKLQIRPWETKEGEKRYSTEVVADEIGVSLLWNEAKTPRALEDGPSKSKTDDPWGQSSHPEEPPF
jgi:single-strand DNA-binding protein